ncbi:MAG: hypothetical protein MUO34_00915, partial [Ignavibacteriaceae bacterium]|nr:hypothetical protein [Ignavibacteriaceae bacterium]
DIKVTDKKILVTVRKIGNVPVPVQLKFVYDEVDKQEIIYENASVWKDGKDEIVFEYKLSDEANVIKIELGSDLIPDTDKTNNIYLLEK